MTQVHAVRCMGSWPQLSAACLSSHICWASDVICKLAPDHQMHMNTAECRLSSISGPTLTPVPVPVPVQVYGAMRKLALEQQAETAQLNAAVQQSGDKEDEDPDLDEDEADAKQVILSWDAWMGLCPSRLPSASQMGDCFRVFLRHNSCLNFPCSTLKSLPGLHAELHLRGR